MSNIWVPEGLISGESCLLTWRLLPPPEALVFLACTHIPAVSSSPYKNISLVELGPHPYLI